MKRLLPIIVIGLILVSGVAAEDLEYRLQYVYENGSPVEPDRMAGFPAKVEIIDYEPGATELSYRISGGGLDLQGLFDVSEARPFGPTGLVLPVSLTPNETASLFLDMAAPRQLIVYTSIAILTFELSGN